MLKIWGRANSINVQKVLWCASELGLAFSRTDLAGPFGGNREPAYLSLNPNGLVPTIEDDGFVLWESNAIVRYLAGRYSWGSLCPADPKVRADADRWMDWQLTTLAADMSRLFLGLVRTPPEQRNHEAIEASRRALCELWLRLDRWLNNREFVAGGTFTMGDIPCGALAYRWFALPIERNETPALRAWYDRLNQRPAFREHVMVALT